MISIYSKPYEIIDGDNFEVNMEGFNKFDATVQ